MSTARTSFYRTIWRWHFYAGLLVMPIVIILSLTGALYLFKPQVERWEERAFHDQPVAGAVSAAAQRDAALAAVPRAAFPAAAFQSYRLPERSGDAAMIHLVLDGGAMRDVFVSPRGRVLGALDPAGRIIEVTRRIHGQLLLGPRGSWLVELAASWAIVMILTGLTLWWPGGRRLAGVLYPRIGFGRRALWRDLHAVTGFWVAGLALVLLVTGLPWAAAWGSGFAALRERAGWVLGAQDWTVGGRPVAAPAGEHAAHDHAGMIGMATPAGATFDTIVARARAERLAFPVLIAPRRGGWTVRSDAADRLLRVTITYDAGGAEISRSGFADQHPIDRAIGYGIAWHEGALFGLVNQLVGLATAVMLIMLAVTGFVLWRRRRPEAVLGAPPAPPLRLALPGVRVAIAVLCLVLPLFALSVIMLWLVDRFVLPRLPGAARWLGMEPGAQHQ